jgi:hypothetical protein
MAATIKGRPLRESIPFGSTVTIESFTVFEAHLEIVYLIDQRIHSVTKIHYPAGMLSALANLYSNTDLRILYCHIALFEGLKYCLTFPEVYDVTEIADGLTQHSLAVFRTVAANAWTQHMYENTVENYFGPELVSKTPVQQQATVIKQINKTDELLCASGGGKDSFLVMKLLEKANIPYAVFQHARSEYGRLDQQHLIQRRILKHLPQTLREHQISIVDDYTDGLLAAAYAPSIRGDCIKGNPCQVGWPEMIFEALPFALLHGYSGFAFGNERSADAVQAVWSDTSERAVNHQWIKSNEASKLIKHFIQTTLLPDFSVFSLLKPIHDQRIYQHLANYPEILPSFHSCNIIKPWCKKCAKCAYVWVNLVAVFGQGPVNKVFGVNLFDDPDIETHWLELLGLGEHNAFECVGEVWETRLAFYRCVQLGCVGRAISKFQAAFLGKGADINWREIREYYDLVYEDHIIPDVIYQRVREFL